MNNDCERFRELLVEAAYDEIGAADERALDAHLKECASCAARRVAFGAVRAQLRDWEVEAPAATSRVTFVTVPAATPTRGPWSRRLAAAASFVIGFLLIAALANVEIQNAGDGWTFRTSLLPRPVADSGEETGATPAGAERERPGPVERLEAEQPRFGVPVSQGGQGGEFRFMSEDDLDSWLDGRLQARNVVRPGSMAELRPEQVRPLLDELMRERDQQVRALIQDALTRAEDRTRDDFDAALTGLYQAFEAQRTNDLMFFAGELGLLQEATGQELQRTNAAIDYLIGLEAVTEPERDEPEPRDPEPRR